MRTGRSGVCSGGFIVVRLLDNIVIWLGLSSSRQIVHGLVVLLIERVQGWLLGRVYLVVRCHWHRPTRLMVNVMSARGKELLLIQLLLLMLLIQLLLMLLIQLLLLLVLLIQLLLLVVLLIQLLLLVLLIQLLLMLLLLLLLQLLMV